MKFICKLILVVVIVSGCYMTLAAQYNPQGQQSANGRFFNRRSIKTRFEPVSLLVKQIDGISRLSGRLISMPHTSERIDSIVLQSRDGSLLTAEDIDGVDFGRYFQWEDEGIIDLEIDFHSVSVEPGDTLLFYMTRSIMKSPVTTVEKIIQR